MVVAASPLLCELFARVVSNGSDYPTDAREGRLIAVMLDELSTLQPAPLHLPLAQDKRLRRIMDLLIAKPADGRTLDELARCCAASSRTLERLFCGQAGMTFFEWRKQLRLLEALTCMVRESRSPAWHWNWATAARAPLLPCFGAAWGFVPDRFATGSRLPRK